MKRGQASIEFITIFGFIFLMTLPLVFIFFDQLGSVKDSISQTQVRNIAIKLADKSDEIYYLGEPSKTTIKAYFPGSIKNINVTARTILFEMEDSKGTLHQVYAVSKVNVTGDISVSEGIHYLIIRASSGQVVIEE